MLKKPLFLAATIAATVSTGANAVAVESNITDVGLWLGATQYIGSINVEPDNGQSGAWADIAIGGDTVDGMTFTGSIITRGVSTTVLQLDFNLSDGERIGPNGTGGTIFRAGTVIIDAFWIGSGPSTIDAAITPVSFLSGADGHLIPCTGIPFSSQCTAGLVVDDSGNGTLGGLWSGDFFDGLPGSFGFNSAATTFTMVDETVLGMWLEGTVSAAVPIPAAAWLFSSALIGLVGIKRRK